jgi:hypothetical protein
MKKILAALLLAAAIPALVNADPSYELKIADCPTTLTNATATATLPYVNLTAASQYAVCVTAHMGMTSNNAVADWLVGTVTCTASNSIDAMTWFEDTARSFTLDVPTNGVTTLLTNFTGMGAVGYEKYTLTVSNNVRVLWTTAVKPGL